MFVNFSKIELALEKKGWNQQDLANASGVSQANISRYIRGKQKPGIEILSKIAHALGIKITDLVDENKPSIYIEEKVLNELAFDNSLNVFFSHDEVFFSFNFDFGTRIFGKKNLIAYFDIQCYSFTIFGNFAIPYGQDFTFLGFFFSCIGNNDTALGFLLFGQSLDDQTIMKGTNLEFFVTHNGGCSLARPRWSPFLRVTQNPFERVLLQIVEMRIAGAI